MPTPIRAMRDFELEVFFSKWEFKARYHMTASDIQSMTLGNLLEMGSDEDREAFHNTWLGYTETYGAPELRAEIASTYATMKSENILCLLGAQEGLYALARCFLEPGDHVIVPTPNYQSAETVPLSVCEVTGIALTESSQRGGWQLDIDAVKDAIQPNTRLLSLNFPHNPTGLLLSKEDQQALIDICRERGIYILSDEVYRGVELNLDDQMPQMADLYEKGISLNVMSKAYGLPGLRLGWFASQDLEVLQKVERYKHYLSICNPAPSEALSLIALKNRAAIIAQNRALILENTLLFEQLLADFPGLIKFERPLGGCVAFPRYTDPGNGEDFCKTLLEKSGVLLLPSSIYASELTEIPQNHFRIGLGRKIFPDGLAAMRRHFETHI